MGSSGENMKLQVLLADDHALFRDGMRYVLQQLSEQVDVICAGDFAETLRQATANPALDLALLDLNMPGSNGVASIRIFNRNFPGIPLVVVSGSDRRTEMEGVMKYGAMGFISKMTSAKEMVNALRMVLAGDIYFPPQLLAQLNAAPGNCETDDKAGSPNIQFGITKRQLQTLQYLAEGYTNKEIAFKLELAEGTIKAHVSGAYQVLRVTNRLDAVRKAQDLGLITLVPAGRNEP